MISAPVIVIGDEGVAERLERERLAEGDHTVALTRRLREGEIGAHTPGVHERDIGAPFDDVAQS